jgi:hypothetical protein
MASQTDQMLTVLHYLFSHDMKGNVNAHCLDLDLVTSGKSIAQAEERLNAVVLAQISLNYSSGNFSQLRFQAPVDYWQKLNAAKELGKSFLEVEVPPAVLPINRNVITYSVFRSETEQMPAAA